MGGNSVGFNFFSAITLARLQEKALYRPLVKWFLCDGLWDNAEHRFLMLCVLGGKLRNNLCMPYTNKPRKKKRPQEALFSRSVYGEMGCEVMEC